MVEQVSLKVRNELLELYWRIGHGEKTSKVMQEFVTLAEENPATVEFLGDEWEGRVKTIRERLLVMEDTIEDSEEEGDWEIEEATDGRR